MHAFGVYGHLAGLTEEELRACMALLGGYKCEIQDDVLDFVHEGGFVDIDSVLDALPSMLSPAARGVIDIIDRQDWKMLRCTLGRGHLSQAAIALDNALDTAYASEIPRSR